ncbi:hypothetical protein EK904_009094 [Melospiza melodia maxima]|nr:hypothetical protein EK904_009094 [Melospiza melodia maxima]
MASRGVEEEFGLTYVAVVPKSLPVCVAPVVPHSRDLVVQYDLLLQGAGLQADQVRLQTVPEVQVVS